MQCAPFSQVERSNRKRMRRNRALARQLRVERTKAQKAMRRAQQGDEKVAVLSEHIEKLMVALRLQAQAKERRQKEEKAAIGKKEEKKEEAAVEKAADKADKGKDKDKDEDKDEDENE